MICFLSSPLRAIFCMNERSQTQHRRNPTQLACSFPPLSSSHGSGPKQSQSPGSVVVWRDYPFPQHEGLFFTSFCLLFTLFSVLSFSLSHLNSVALVLAARCAGHSRGRPAFI